MDNMNVSPILPFFQDLFADRQYSVRRVLEDTFQQEMREVEEREKRMQRHKPVPGEAPEEMVPEPPVVPVRYRHQVAQGPAHDLFGDAVHAMFQKLMARGQMADYCHYLAYLLTKQTELRMGTDYEKVRFEAGVYENQGTEEIKKKFGDEMWPSADSILVSDGRRVEALNDKWSGIYISADQKKGNRHKQEDRFLAYPSGLYINRGNVSWDFKKVLNHF